MDNLIKKIKGELSIVSWIKRKIKRNQNTIAITIGSVGSGKSYLNIALAKQIDPEFNIKKQIVFKFSSLMKLISEPEFKKKKYKIVIYEEFQISASNRLWQSTLNKLINYLFSTFRHQNIILFLNCPYRDFIDSQTRKLVQCLIEMRSIDRKTKTARASVKLLQYNDKMKKYYEHCIFVINPTGKVKQIGIIRVKKPQEEDCNAYEKIKLEFTNKLNQEILRDAMELETTGGKVKHQRPLTELQEKIKKCIADGIETQSEIAKICGTTDPQISRNLAFMRNKGHIRGKGKEMKVL